MFEITGSDIAALSDEDLRTLLGLLCEADLRRRNLPTSAVTAGGDQNAPDGGVDVRVALPQDTPIDGFIPRPVTAFQSKKSDLAGAGISKEMRPGGILRPALVELAAAGGAYVIVSANAKVSDAVLKNRKAAMSQAVNAAPFASGLGLDYYDGGRVATWVRDHPGLIPWVRARIGRSLRGWQSFGPWSRQLAGVEAGYLLDDAARIHTGSVGEGDGLTAADGIDRMRAALRRPGQAVRLVGLSGVGKTRLAEALFDPAVGRDGLDPSLAVYTDIADEPDPQPGGLTADLITGRTRAILIVDNCPPETHRRLADIVTAADSTVSLLTIEYDIQDGEPEDTAVFALDTSSPEVIARLVARRFPALSEVDTRTVAEFSGGNARIALALAGVAPKHGTVASLGDKELFRRLFQQRNDPDASLLSIAQACALLYSFEGDALDGETAELPILGGLIGRPAEAVRAAVVALKRRQLVQARGPWRAVLPHAVANRLAAAALEDIPRSRLLAALVEGASARVLRSFSRRLGYLDGSAEAQAIVRSWLAPGGPLADVAHLSELGVAVLINVAPVAPDAVLTALEGALGNADEDALRRCTPLIRLMRSLAYDAGHFERSVALLVRMARLPREEHRLSEHAGDILEALFHIVLSGTEAPLDARLRIVERLLHTESDLERSLGVRLLGALLRTDSFSSSHEFAFGARSRGFGLQPRDEREVRDWYAAGLQLAEGFALSEHIVAEEVRKVVADAFPGLWIRGGQAETLTRFTRAVTRARGFWHAGWDAVRLTRISLRDEISSDTLADLAALEDLLRPRSLVDRVRSLVLGSDGRGSHLDHWDAVDEDDAAATQRRAAAIERLAAEVLADDEAFQALLPELAGGSGDDLCTFGESMARTAGAPRTVWRALVEQTGAVCDPSLVVLRCFLSGLQRRDAGLADALLDEAIEDPVLACWFPHLQGGLPLDDAALTRLHRALDAGVAPIWLFSILAYGGACNDLTEAQLKLLLLRIADAEGGDAVARRILYMRLHADRRANREVGRPLAEVGRAFLSAVRFVREDRRTERDDRELALIARVFLADEAGRVIARDLSRALMYAISSNSMSSYPYDDLIRALMAVQPIEALNALLSGNEIQRTRIIHELRKHPRPGKSLMSGVPDEVVIAWCDHAPAERYPLAATFTQLFTRPRDTTRLAWTDLALRLLSGASDPVAVFDVIIERLRPNEWSGSLAAEMQIRLDLLDSLDIAALPVLSGPLETARLAFGSRIERERRRERERERERNSRFE
ncbi:hypothetical protein Q8W71_21280 [Methylobacterium sp. NEAU 140]|uniref:hypothetical protein n=1 Tax=Methylobacterium sp. NEAU 140 TaxID=3064945 RepID=UPI002733B068|nr:hypothetical protein [Methylobacterium sp. NEAU 140]MDP4025168.1 hypothetical protein [Methylobacterium sp. NEAU 140]